MAHEPHEAPPGGRAGQVAPSQTAETSHTAQGGSRGAVLARVALCATAGLLAAGLGRLAITRTGDVFQMSPELAAISLQQNPNPEDQARRAAAMADLQYRHAALWLAEAAGILGLLLGLTQALFRRAGMSRSIAAVAGGSCASALFGAIAGALAVWIEHRTRAAAAEQVATAEWVSMLMHGVPWLVVGIGCALGTAPGAVARGVSGRLLVAGVAGLLGGAVFPFVAGVALPLANTAIPFPDEPQSRLLWLALPAVLIGLALGRRG